MNKYTKLTEVFQTSSVQIIDQKQTILENATQSIASRKDISSAAKGDEDCAFLYPSSAFHPIYSLLLKTLNPTQWN